MATPAEIAEIAKAVATANAAPEYCLKGFSESWLTCLDKPGWAAWVQAIGAVAAILWAFWIGRAESRRRTVDADAEFKRQVVYAARICQFAKENTVECFRMAKSLHPTHRLEVDLQGLDSTQQLITSSISAELDFQLLIPLMNAHNAFAKVVSIFRGINDAVVGTLNMDSISDDGAEIVSVFDDSLAEIRRVGLGERAPDKQVSKHRERTRSEALS